MELRDKFEIKVFILFLLKNMTEPLEFCTLNDIAIQDGFVTYFDFAICFGELLEVGQIVELQTEPQTYVISDDGRVALEAYESSIYASIREKALRSALRLLAFYRTGTRIDSRIEPDGKGWNFICEITDKQSVVFRTQVYVTEYAFAEKLKANYDERAEIIYNGTLALLSGDVNFIFDE